jgi:hypothetical protein
MRETIFYPRQAKKIYGWQYSKTMKPVKVKDRLFQGGWDNCRGFVDKTEPDFYCVEFSHSKQAGTRRFYFTQVQTEKLMLLTNPWLDDPILNKSGLAHKVYPDAEGNSLRRRLEQKGERGTFTEEEKKRIVEVLENYLKQVKESLKL